MSLRQVFTDRGSNTLYVRIWACDGLANFSNLHYDQAIAITKTCKREINKSFTNYKRTMRNKFRQMKQKSLKDIWNCVTEDES